MTRYLIIFIVMTIAGMGMIASFHHWTDPYGIYNVKDRGAFPIKPAIANQQYLSKSQAIRQLKPEIVLIGSSRADYGLRPDHPAFEGKNIYNAGLKALTISEARAIVSHAIHSGVKHIMLSLDFYMFNANMTTPPHFDSKYLYDENHTRTPDTGWQTLISLSTIKPAIKTYLAQDDPLPSNVLINGWHNGADLDKKTDKKSALSVFQDHERMYLSRIYFPVPSRAFSFYDQTKNYNSWNDLTAMISIAEQYNIHLTFMISPLHIRMLGLIKQAGLFDLYRSWKLRLAELSNQYEIPLYDFTDINTVTTETIPTTKGIAMRYFWEGSHYKPIIGDAMISEIFGMDDLRINSFQSKPITLQNLLDFEDMVVDWLCKHPDTLDDINKAIRLTGIEKTMVQNECDTTLFTPKHKPKS